MLCGMDIVMQILSQPFTWGLVVGLFLMSMFPDEHGLAADAEGHRFPP